MNNRGYYIISAFLCELKSLCVGKEKKQAEIAA